MFAGAAAAFGRIRDVLPERVLHRLSGEVFGGGRTTVLILLAAVVAAVIAGIVLTSLRLANFTLVRDGDRLRISRGLLAQRSGTIPVDRVQAVRVVQGWWRRMLGYCALEVEVAGISASNDAERMLFPLVRIALAPDLVALALPEMRWHPSPLQPVPAGARRRYFTLPVVLALVVTAGLALLPGWGWYLALAPVPVALLIGWGQAAAAAWAIDEDTVTFRWHRILSRHTVIARRGRVQLTEISRTPFQRRAGLAGTRLLLSSKRRARLRHMEFDDALMLLHAVGRRAHPPGNAVGEARAHMPATYREP
jgi:putative membrane protein